MDDINTRILNIFQKVAFLVESEWDDLDNINLDPEDDRNYQLDEIADEKERMKYYLDGEHPYDYAGQDPADFKDNNPDEPYDTTEEDLLENGATIYGNDGDPYVEDELGKHRDIHPDLTLDNLDDFEDGEDDGLSLARELIPEFDKDSIDRHDDEEDEEFSDEDLDL